MENNFLELPLRLSPSPLALIFFHRTVDFTVHGVGHARLKLWCLSGKLKPIVKSQPIPKNNKGPVKVVVGKTFDEIVMDTNKDVLIEFYAPWCGHCKKLEPDYLALGKKYKEEKHLVIAKMDATANDVPDSYKVEGFPTIYFAPSNRKQEPVKFEGGDRTVEGFTKFVEKHATKLSQKDEL